VLAIMHDVTEKQEKRRELSVFLFLTFVLWPLLTVMAVGAYGFIIWFSQWFLGPPGPG
jgi:nitrate reductase NapE